MVRFRLIGKRPKIRFDAKRGKIAKRRRGSRLCTLKNRLVIHDGIARALRMHYMTRSFALCQWWPTTDTGRDHSRRRSSTTKYKFVLSRMNSRGIWRAIIFSRNMACYHEVQVCVILNEFWRDLLIAVWIPGVPQTNPYRRFVTYAHLLLNAEQFAFLFN